ncbi:methyltransferase [Actinorhabdospora filicis]|uniref:Methyltransferase n=1 Tax=Actinorhabdospora filicis TaxID=1785913 RepID=A0A9W6W9H3_9ACTN|nr:SAM-dependent methyltransferase [Actinorhabdospora filicis]GLZ76640.1 methyltransferase [Actinorhabdospora filicis]
MTADLSELRALLLDRDRLVSAVAAGRIKGTEAPPHTRLRPVTVKAGEALQLETSDGARPTVQNLPWTPETVDELLARPYGNWHVELTDATVQVRVTKRGKAFLHRTEASRVRDTSHDRAKPHLIAPDDPLFDVVGGDAAKRRQVDAFLHLVDGSLTGSTPLRVVDFGCGNAYLTFAAYRHLAASREVEVIGVDVREDQRVRNGQVATELGCADRVRFVADTAASADLPGADVVLALHACDTATDEALARGVSLGAAHIFAAPCCHHDIAAQLRSGSAPAPYGSLVRDGILLERFADTLTDALRALLLRSLGYEVDVVEFIASAHTPRNTMLRARRADVPAALRTAARVEYDGLVAAWGVKPRLAGLLG